MTTYIVMRKDTARDLRVLGVKVAHGPKQAIRELALGDDAPGSLEGTYVAVPMRNWTEMALALETPAPIVRLTEMGAIGVIDGQESMLDEPEPEPATAAPVA
jgi:hypothetical protein